MSRTVLTGAGRLLMAAQSDHDRPETISGPWSVEIEDGHIVSVLDSRASGGPVVDLGGALVTPGLVDAHTHLIYAGDRSAEAAARSAGEPYTGGGILSTVAMTRAASDAELVEGLERRLRDALAHGTTTIEVKSGYGLSIDQELRLLRLIRVASERVSIRVVRTFLGAHAVPADARSPDEYTDSVIAGMSEAAEEADFADVFCEPGLFDLDATARILRGARAVGLGLRLHADQLTRSGATELGVRLGAESIDHLERATRADAEAIARSTSVATLLPGPALMLRAGLPPARSLIDAGATVAIGSDANAGTFGSADMTLAIGLAVGVLGLTLTEAIAAATEGAARSLRMAGTVGVIRPGAAADLVAWDAEHEGAFAHRLGAVQPTAIYVGGQLVTRSRATP